MIDSHNYWLCGSPFLVDAAVLEAFLLRKAAQAPIFPTGKQSESKW